jgi:MoxR-like ATPase
MTAAKALALTHGRRTATIEDVAQLAPSVLSHRVVGESPGEIIKAAVKAGVEAAD